MRPLIRVTTIEDGVTTVRTNEPDPAVVSLAALMECSKRELACQVLELIAELDCERVRREQGERDCEMSYAIEMADDAEVARLMKEDRKAAHAEARAVIQRRRTNTGVPAVGSFG